MNFELVENLTNLCRDWMMRGHGGLPYTHVTNLQYTSVPTMRDYAEGVVDTVSLLDPNLSYLNIGTGIGLLELEARQRSRNITTVEQVFNPRDSILQVFKFWNKELDVKVDYEMRGYLDESFEIIDIPEDASFDDILIWRFGPFQAPLKESRVDSFLNSIKKYSVQARVGEVTLDPDLRQYLVDKWEAKPRNGWLRIKFN